MRSERGIYTAGSAGTLTLAQIRRNTAGGTSALNWSAWTKNLMLAPGTTKSSLPTLNIDSALSAPALTLTGDAIIGGTLTLGIGVMLSAGVAALPARTTAAPALKVGGQQHGLSAATANLLVASAGGTASSTFGSTGLAVAGNISWSSDQRLKADIHPSRLGQQQRLHSQLVTFQWIGRRRRRGCERWSAAAIPDLEATYLTAASKGTAPAARSMPALSDRCAARGSAGLGHLSACACTLGTSAPPRLELGAAPLSVQIRSWHLARELTLLLS